MKTSVSLDAELTEYVEEISDHAGDNDAEAIRDAVRRARDLDDRLGDHKELQAEVEELREEVDRLEDAADERDRLQDRVDELEGEVEAVRNEKRLILQEREEKKELAKFAEEERTASERWRKAGLTQRIKWRITGMPDGDE